MPHKIRSLKIEICKALLRPLISCSTLNLSVKSYSCHTSVFEAPQHVKQCMRPRGSSWSGKWRNDCREHKTQGTGVSFLSSKLLRPGVLLSGEVQDLGVWSWGPRTPPMFEEGIQGFCELGWGKTYLCSPACHQNVRTSFWKVATNHSNCISPYCHW